MQVLEACMKNCGRRFHNEVGKYRFLNELIKVVSPKVSSLQIDLYFKQMKSALDCVSCYPPSLKFTSCFPVHGWNCTWEGKDEDCGDAVQLDSGFSKWGQDQWSVPDTKETGCVQMIDITLVKRHPPQRNLINPALAPLTRSGDAWPGVTAGQDSDPFSSNTTQTSGVWQRRHGQGDRLY